MTPAEKISTARTRLVLGHPFYASLVLPMQCIEDYSVKAAGVDGKSIRYNPSFIDSIPTEECVALLAHEGLHIGMCHHTRGEHKDHGVWNKACDYAVNPILKKANFKLPANGLLSERFDDMYAEKIYGILMKEKQDENKGDDPKNQQGNGNGQGQGAPQPGNDKGDGNNQQQGNSPAPEDWGSVEQNNPKKTGESNEEAESKAKQRLVQAMNAAKAAGTNTGGLERIVKDIVETKTPWEEILNRFLSETAHNDYNWSMPNRRFIASGAYLPELRNEEMGSVVFAIDTSGSVNKEMLNKFASELKTASELFKIPVKIIHCDTRVKHVEDLDPDEDISPVGGGGTDFRPPFEYVYDNDVPCKALVYLTDGRCSQFPDEPHYETLWCIYGNHKNYSPPFGEVIHID